MLSLVKKRNQAVSDGTTNRSLEHLPTSGRASGRSGFGTSTSSSSPSFPSPQTSPDGEEHHEHHKWRFAYHRVHDLNAAGQPTSRGIAAVISLDTPATLHTNLGENENTNKNNNTAETGSNSGTGTTLKTSGITSSSSSINKEMGELKIGAGASSSSSSLLSSFPLSDDPNQAGRSSASVSNSNSNNHNIISNSFNRFGNKEKHVDLASDKSSRRGSGSPSDIRSRENSAASVSGSNRMVMSSSSSPSALVLPLPKEIVVSQRNDPNSHKIQWDRRHGQGGGGEGDEVLSTELEERQVKELAESDTMGAGATAEDGKDEQGSQHYHHHHHPARHHHHIRKNYYHHSTHNQEQKQRDENHQHHNQRKFKPGLEHQLQMSPRVGGHLTKDFTNPVEHVDHDEVLFIPQQNNNNHNHDHHPGRQQDGREPLSQSLSQSDSHHHQKQNNNNNENHHSHLSLLEPGSDQKTVGVAGSKNYHRQHSSTRNNHRDHGHHHHHPNIQQYPNSRWSWVP